MLTTVKLTLLRNQLQLYSHFVLNNQTTNLPPTSVPNSDVSWEIIRKEQNSCKERTPFIGVVQPNKTHGHGDHSQFIFKCGHDEKGHSKTSLLCYCTMAILGKNIGGAMNWFQLAALATREVSKSIYMHWRPSSSNLCHEVFRLKWHLPSDTLLWFIYLASFRPRGKIKTVMI